MPSNECYSYLIKILNLKDYSKQELINKSLQKNFTEIETIETIERILNLNYINDRRLADNILEFYSKNHGGYMIRQKLEQRLIEEDIIESVLENLEMDYSEITRTVTTKFDPTEFKQKQKAYRYLMTRGYDSSDIREIIR